MSTEAQQELTRYQELREVLENLMLWQVKNVRVWNNGAYDQASMVIERHDTALQKALAEPQPEPVAWMTQARNFVHPMEFTEEEAKSYGWKAVYTSPPAQQEPVEYWTVANGWVSDQAEVPAAVWVEPDFWEHCNRVNCGTAYRLPAPGRQPLYTAPPAQEFVCSTGLCHYRKPLTDEEIENIAAQTLFPIDFARAIEAAHSIKENA